MKDILGKYARERNGRDFVYARVGSLELYLYPKDDPSNVNETNLKKLLTELEKLEVDYHSSIEKARNELLSLSPSVSKQYKPKGQVKAEEETRRRQLVIFGFGIEGESFAKEVASKTEVYVFDPIPANLVLARSRGYKMVKTKEDGLRSADIIVGCTGRKLLESEDYKILKDGVVLIDPKSQTTEFDVDWIENHCTKALKKPSGFSQYLIFNKKINLVTGTFTKEKLEKVLTISEPKIETISTMRYSHTVGTLALTVLMAADKKPVTKEEIIEAVKAPLSQTKTSQAINDLIKSGLITRKNDFIMISERGKKIAKEFTEILEDEIISKNKLKK